jgi:hypothetical protein
MRADIEPQLGMPPVPPAMDAEQLPVGVSVFAEVGARCVHHRIRQSGVIPAAASLGPLLRGGKVD